TAPQVSGRTGEEQGSGRENGLRRVRRAIVVVDMVESVRLMQTFEDDVIERWRQFLHALRTELLPAKHGRLVKSLGDGVLLEFADAPHAATATLRMHEIIASYNVGHRVDDAIL